jgi:death-on-curing protein
VATADVIAMHDELIRLTGGVSGLPNPGYLDSALAAPQQTYTYDPGCDLYDLAASYLFHIAKGHAFTDGNKRTAYATTLVFLSANGVFLYQPKNVTAVAELAVQVADDVLDKPALAGRLRRLAAALRDRNWRDVVPAGQRRQSGAVHLRRFRR